jgi:fatty-acyl-CoA synthase
MQAGREPAPERTALIERGGDGLAGLTYGELAARVEAATRWFAARGVAPGDVVAVWLPNWFELVVCEFALANLGAVLLGVNTRYSVHELTNVFARGRPVGVVMPHALLDLDFRGRLQRSWDKAREEGLGAEPPWVAIVRGEPEPGFDLGGGVARFPAGTKTADEPAAAPAPAYSGEALLNAFTTSGSTGKPKLAAHDQASVLAHSRSVLAAFGFDAESVFLGALPLTGVFGFNPAMATLAAGGTVLLEPVFDVATALADIEECAVTHVIGGDDLLAQLMDGWQPGMSASVRRGGVADHRGRTGEFAEWASREWGATIAGVYGSSEIFALAATWSPERPLEERIRPGGEPVAPEIGFRVVGDADAPLPPGEIGELQARGPCVLDAYIGDDRLLADSTTADGWFRTGDLGRMTGEGSAFLYAGRDSDALRLRGFLVEPKEVETYLMGHPAVAGARLVGVRTRDRGDVAVAFVLPVEGAEVTPEELRDHCRAELAPFKVPSVIELVDAFPTVASANGAKIRTADLRERAAELIG